MCFNMPLPTNARNCISIPIALDWMLLATLRVSRCSTLVLLAYFFLKAQILELIRRHKITNARSLEDATDIFKKASLIHTTFQVPFRQLPALRRIGSIHAPYAAEIFAYQGLAFALSAVSIRQPWQHMSTGSLSVFISHNENSTYRHDLMEMSLVRAWVS